jgi:hypothetical protein
MGLMLSGMYSIALRIWPLFRRGHKMKTKKLGAHGSWDRIRSGQGLGTKNFHSLVRCSEVGGVGQSGIRIEASRTSLESSIHTYISMYHHTRSLSIQDHGAHYMLCKPSLQTNVLIRRIYGQYQK